MGLVLREGWDEWWSGVKGKDGDAPIGEMAVSVLRRCTGEVPAMVERPRLWVGGVGQNTELEETKGKKHKTLLSKELHGESRQKQKLLKKYILK